MREDRIAYPFTDVQVHTWPIVLLHSAFGAITALMPATRRRMTLSKSPSSVYVSEKDNPFTFLFYVIHCTCISVNLEVFRTLPNNTSNVIRSAQGVAAFCKVDFDLRQGFITNTFCRQLSISHGCQIELVSDARGRAYNKFGQEFRSGGDSIP